MNIKALRLAHQTNTTDLQALSLITAEVKATPNNFTQTLPFGQYHQSKGGPKNHLGRPSSSKEKETWTRFVV